MIRSLYYHNPKPEGFEAVIRHLHSKGYKFISINELYDRLKRRDIKGKLAYISLDDGWQGNLKLIPIIEKYNVPITIFIAVKPIIEGNYWWEFVAKKIGYSKMQDFKNLPHDEFESQLKQIKTEVGALGRSAMTMDKLKEVAKHPLVSIQSHTVNHPILTKLPNDLLEFELSESKKHLEEITGTEVFAFSYPNGSLTDREINATKKHYKIAFSTNQNNIRVSDDIYTLPRYALTGDYKRDLLKLHGLWKYLMRCKNYFK